MHGAAPLYQKDRIFTVTTLPQEVMPQDEGRTSLVIQVTGAANLLVGFGQNPSAASLSIAPGSPFQFQTAPGDALYFQAVAGTITVLVLAG